MRDGSVRVWPRNPGRHRTDTFLLKTFIVLLILFQNIYRSYEEKTYTPPAKIAISSRCLTLSILLRKRAIFLPKFKKRPYSASLNGRRIVDILWCLSELEAFQLDSRLHWIKEFYRTTFLLNLCKLIWLPTFHGDLLDSFRDRLDF